MNKAEEWVLLKAAFLPAEIHGAVESESPDFLVPRDELDLGIEVTEAFMSESQARMELIPDYLGEVLHDRRYRHRSDKKAYPIKRVRWTAKDGSLVDLEGIVYLNPNTEQQTSRLESAIISKASRVSSYRSRCSTVELIVHDRGIFSERVQKSEIARIFHNKSLRNAIQRSGFREIRYLVRAKEGGLFCYPVRIGFLAEELLLFFGALAEVKCTESTARVGAALSCHLTNAGFQSVSVFCGDSKKVSVVSDVAAAVYESRAVSKQHLRSPFRGRVEARAAAHESARGKRGRGSAFLCEIRSRKRFMPFRFRSAYFAFMKQEHTAPTPPNIVGRVIPVCYTSRG